MHKWFLSLRWNMVLHIKGCLVTGWEKWLKGKNFLKAFVSAERNIPEAVWFGKNNILIIIRKPNGCWDMEREIYYL